MSTHGVDEKTDSGIQVRFSVRNRVIAGFATVVMAFTCLITYSIVLHRQTTAELSLINSTYLPLTLGTSDIRATQLVFNTLMDRLADDPNQSVTRDWIDAARRYRPVTLKRLEKLIRRALRSNIPEDEAAFLSEMKRRLRQVGKRYRDNEAKFSMLYSEMDAGHVEEATGQIESLKRSERLLDKVLAGIESELNRHITEVATIAEQDSVRATLALVVLTVVALLVGGAVVLSIHRLLAPLKRLQAAVANVARGKLETRIEVGRQDEIGVLASGFNRMTDALAERDQMLIRSEQLATAGKMAAQVTHEIRNPLSSLGLNAELLDEELGAGATEARTLLGAMQDEIERLTGITESYLSFARLPEPEPEFGDLNAVVEASLDFMAGEFSELGITAESRINRDLPPVLFDKGQIRQALINLLRNACEAMPEGGKVRVTTGADEKNVEMRISDTGVGIPPQAVKQIFESFYTTKSGGTGLGLAMVRQICLAHSGEVRHEETDDPGSVFVVSLPSSPMEKREKDDDKQTHK